MRRFISFIRPAFLVLLVFCFARAQSNRVGPSDTHQSASAAFEEGQSAQQRGELHSAIKLYSTAIAADASLYQAYYQRGTALLGLGRQSEAEADFKKVIQLEPGFARAHRAIGLMLLDRGDTDEAKRAFARAIQLDPELTGVRVYYGSALLKSGDPQRAIENLEIAIQHKEEPALATALLGVSCERLGRIDEAFADFSRAIQLDPNLAVAYEGRARVHEKRGELPKAIEDYTAAYRVQPSRETAMFLADLHARAGQPEAAIRLYRRLISEKPDELPARAELARLLAESGQVDEAIKEVGIVVGAKPKDAKLLTTAGDVCFKERPDLAIDYYRRALEADPGNNRARVQLGASLVRSLQFDAALPVLGDAISRESDNYSAHVNLATAFFKLKRYPEAAREFIWVIRSRPELPASYYFLAISLDHIGDCEQALRGYREFVSRADIVAYKREVEDANIRVVQLERLIHDKKCKPLIKGKS